MGGGALAAETLVLSGLRARKRAERRLTLRGFGWGPVAARGPSGVGVGRKVGACFARLCVDESVWKLAWEVNLQVLPCDERGI